MRHFKSIGKKIQLNLNKGYYLRPENNNNSKLIFWEQCFHACKGIYSFFQAWLKPDELIMTSANNEKPPLRFLIKNGKDASFVSFDIKEDVHLTGKKSFCGCCATANKWAASVKKEKAAMEESCYHFSHKTKFQTYLPKLWFIESRASRWTVICWGCRLIESVWLIRFA